MKKSFAAAAAAVGATGVLVFGSSPAAAIQPPAVPVYLYAGGTHGSRISKLPAEEKAAATAMVLDWAGLTPMDPAARKIAKTGKPERNATLDIKPDYLQRRGL